MNREELAETLDRQIENAAGSITGECEPLLAIASDLRRLPSWQFKDHLRAELLAQAEALDVECAEFSSSNPFVASSELPQILEPREFSMLPADPRSFLLSFVSHAAVVVLIASGIWVGQRTVIKTKPLSSELTYLPLPSGENAPHGGGTSGDHSTVPVSRGTPPKFREQQLAPPAIIVKNTVAKLQVDPTLQGPPQLKLPQSNQLGDLLATNNTIPSSGIGGNGGMGSNHGTGIGSGNGPGFGSGTGGGCCNDVFRVGNGVSPPRAVYDPDPEYSEEARKAKYQGTVVLAIVVDPSGHPRDVRVARSLGMGLDQKAVEAVEKWKFTPGLKDGMAVAVQVNVEVSFRLY